VHIPLAPNFLAQTSRAFTADEVLSPYVPVFYASFLVAFLFTPVMQTVARYYGIIDRPDNVRKIHSGPVAYLGGVAVFLGWICGLAISQYMNLHRPEVGWPINTPSVPFSIVVGAVVIIVLGLWDDVRKVGPGMKIVGQTVAAVFLLLDNVGTYATRPILEPLAMRLYPLATGRALSMLTPPFWYEAVLLSTSAVLVIMVVVGCCNATNLLDGLDGLCGGVTAVIAAGFLFVAVHLAMFGGGVNTNWDALRVILGLALLGAVLGFIPFNFNPASIFMGDTGSMFLGYSCAVMIVLMAQERSKWFLASMVMFALPVLDTSLAFARRWIARRPLFSADAQHFHHQLVARGFTVRQTVLISYALAIVFAGLGAMMVYTRTRYAIAIYLVTFGSIIVAAYKIGMVHERPRGGPPTTLGDPEAEDGTAVVNTGSVFEIPAVRGGNLASGVEPAEVMTADPSPAGALQASRDRIVPPAA
jgi:UDP-GlcNAc:undecaprenyl-phosphate GlcNAc-1-phosphate transferase